MYYIETEFNIVEYSFCIADRYQKWPSYKFQELTKLNRKLVQFCKIYTNLFVSLKNSQYFVSYRIALMSILAISRFPDFPISRSFRFPIMEFVITCDNIHCECLVLAYMRRFLWMFGTYGFLGEIFLYFFFKWYD